MGYKLPSWERASYAVEFGDATPLDVFIADYELAAHVEWREKLAAAIEFAIEDARINSVETDDAEMADVRAFSVKFKQLNATTPRHLTRRKLAERANFMFEELIEFAEASGLRFENGS